MNIFKLTNPFKICIIATILTTLFTQTLSIDSKFTSCEPRACKNGPVIRYPFWLSDQQEAFCGYPGFRVTCNGSHPVIRISNDKYVIKDIFHSNNSLLVANDELYTEQCPVPRQNFSLSEAPFTLGSDHISDLSFFYNCSLKPPNFSLLFPKKCLGNQTLHSFAAFHVSALRLANYSVDSCESWVNVPAGNAASSAGFDALLHMNYTEILKMGFVLKWTGHDCGGCEASGGRCGSDDGVGFVCFCGDRPHDRVCDDGRGTNWKVKISIGLVTAFVAVMLMSVVFFIYIRRYRKRHATPYYFSRKISSERSHGKDVEKGSTILGVRVFTYEELVAATNEFDVSKELGDGGFGTVYYGKLKDGRSVAVKRLYENNYKRVEQFMTEIEILAQTRHPNLVSLYGCTSQHGHELLLVYEFVPNGTVADHLHGARGPPTGLPWPTRLRIALGTASALAHLHHKDIIHRDVKTNNILLDENFTVKVADFGLSRLFPTHVTHVSTAPQGTPGYVDPDYHLCYQLTSKSDVFSFGVVLMELVSSLPAVDISRHRHDINLSTMAVNRIQNHALGELVDKRLGFESDVTVRRSVTAVAELAFQCLQQDKDLRPCMATVLSELTAIQSRDYGAGKVEKTGDNGKDDAVLLKNGSVTLSPDSVTMNWPSRDTTPNPST